MNEANAEMFTVFGILGVAGVLFASGRVRLDVVALLSVLVLMLTGILTPREALAGFGDPVLLLVAALLVVGESLTRTGVAHSIGLWLMIGGMLTLIATTPNLVVSSELAAKGHEPLAFFSSLPVGLAVLAVGMLYMLLLGRRLLPGGGGQEPRSDAQTMDELAAGFEILDRRQRLCQRFGVAYLPRGLRESSPRCSGLHTASTFPNGGNEGRSRSTTTRTTLSTLVSRF